MNYFDLHCDTIYELSQYGLYREQRGTLVRNQGQLDLTRAQRFSHYAQVFALFCGAKSIKTSQQAHIIFKHLLDTAQDAFAQSSDVLLHCKTAEDFVIAQQQGKTAAFLSIEGAELLQTAEDVQLAIDAGVRIVTLTWNHRSCYGCGAATDNNGGLTQDGIRLAQYLSKNGVFLDVSHLSERGFWDLAEHISTPILATHSNSRSICPHLRNLTDEQFLQIVSCGGLVGINLFVPFVTSKEQATCDDLVRHIEHFCELGGEHHLCIGADWDGCDRLPDGIDDITAIERLADTLARYGYSDIQIQNLMYNNAKQFVMANF